MRRLGTRHLWVLATLTAVAVSAVRPMVDNSLLWHVEAGKAQLAAGEVLRTDPFSFTFAGEPWRTQSWLADIGYATLEGWMPNVAWIPWFLALAGVAFLGLLAIEVYREARSPAVVGIALAVLFVITTRFLVPRPVMLSLVAFAAVVVASRHRASHWTLPLLLWVWAAVHGSWVLGIGFLVLEAVRRRSRRFAVLSVASLVAASLTAHGLAVWQILWRFALNRDALDVIQEWQRPDFLELQFMPYLVAVVGIGIGVAQRRLTRSDLVVVVPFMLFGFTSARATLPALIVLVPYAVRPLRGAWSGAGTRSSLNVVIAGSLAALAFVVLVAAESGPNQDRFPVAAASFVDPGSTFHSDVVGGYLIYRGDTVFVDDRAELYGAEFFRLFRDARDAKPGWEELFSEYAITTALLAVDDELADVLDMEGWRTLYRDDSFVVFETTDLP